MQLSYTLNNTMKNPYLAITAGAAACAFFVIPLSRAEDQPDKFDKAKKLEERIRKAEAPVVSTTTKTAPPMRASEFRPPQRLHITAPPPPGTTSATTVNKSTTTAQAPSASTVTTSTATAQVPAGPVTKSTSTATTTSKEEPQKNKPAKK